MITSGIQNDSTIDSIPEDLSFFVPYLRYYVKQIRETDGEVQVSRLPDGTISGIFLYDHSEKTGVIFSRSREVFDYFFDSKPFDYLFAELGTEHENEPYDIYTLDLTDVMVDHSFSHEISIAASGDIDALKQFMISSSHRMNSKWVEVAMRDNEKCFLVRFGSEIAGLGWVSLVNGIGRLHSLYVKPQYRRLRIGEDLLFARLYWLKSNESRSVFSEISRFNSPSSKIAQKGQMSPTGQLFLYFRRPKPSFSEPRTPDKLERSSQ